MTQLGVAANHRRNARTNDPRAHPPRHDRAQRKSTESLRADCAKTSRSPPASCVSPGNVRTSPTRSLCASCSHDSHEHHQHSGHPPRPSLDADCRNRSLAGPLGAWGSNGLPWDDDRDVAGSRLRNGMRHAIPAEFGKSLPQTRGAQNLLLGHAPSQRASTRRALARGGAACALPGAIVDVDHAERLVSPRSSGPESSRRSIQSPRALVRRGSARPQCHAPDVSLNEADARFRHLATLRRALRINGRNASTGKACGRRVKTRSPAPVEN